MSNEIGTRIAEARQRSGLSQAELGEKSGIAQTQISRYESGRAVPRRDALMKLAEALGVHAGWLMEGPAYQPPAPIALEVQVEDVSIPAETLVIPAALSSFVLGFAEGFNGSVAEAVKDIITRYMALAAFSPTGHPRVPNMASLVAGYSDLELQVENLRAEMEESKRIGDSLEELRAEIKLLAAADAKNKK